MVTVCIPTLLTKEEIAPLINKIKETFTGEIIASCIRQSASKNRNYCINTASNDIIVMIDDDIEGFYNGWVDDLCEPLIKASNFFSIVASRLIDKDGNKAPQMGADSAIDGDYQIADHWAGQFVCSACIAFNRSDGILFDCDYPSAVCEDTQFCYDYRQKFPLKNVIVNNKCRLIHRNEMKRLDKKDVSKNFEIFKNKTGIKLI